MSDLTAEVLIRSVHKLPDAEARSRELEAKLGELDFESQFEVMLSLRRDDVALKFQALPAKRTGKLLFDPRDIYKLADRTGEFEIEGEVGRGGLGVVLKAKEKLVGRTVAIKLLQQFDGRTVAQFGREARHGAQLRHPNIIHYLGHGLIRFEESLQPFFYVEYIENGRNLDAVMQEKLSDIGLASFSSRAKIEAMISIAEAIHYSHDRSIVHADLKPGNIMIEMRAGSVRPVVIDWGISRKSDPQNRSFDDLFELSQGTPAYLAPEQARLAWDLKHAIDSVDALSRYARRNHGDLSKIDHRVDVYGLGALLYRMYVNLSPQYTMGRFQAGHSDYARVNAEIRRLQEAQEDRSEERLFELQADRSYLEVGFGELKSPRLFDPGIDEALETIILTALHRDPDRRYRGADRLAGDLRRYLGGEFEQIWKRGRKRQGLKPKAPDAVAKIDAGLAALEREIEEADQRQDQIRAMELRVRRAEALADLADRHAARRQDREARDAYNRAASAAKEEKIQRSLQFLRGRLDRVQVRAGMARAAEMIQRGNTGRAIPILEEMLESARRLRGSRLTTREGPADTDRIVELSIDLIDCHLDQARRGKKEHYRKIADVAKRTLTLARENIHFRGIGSMVAALASVAEDLGDRTGADWLAETAMSFADKASHDREAAASLLLGAARCQKICGNSAHARKTALEAMEIARRGGVSEMMAETALLLGKLSHELGISDEVRSYFDSAMRGRCSRRVAPTVREEVVTFCRRNRIQPPALG